MALLNERSDRIAVNAGDGIGEEVMPEGVCVLEAAAARSGLTLALDAFHLASCGTLPTAEAGRAVASNLCRACGLR